MDPQIFISYSSKDQKVARTICTALENRGLSCWISFRNVKPGQNHQEQIVKAIRTARIMVLVFTANANNSNEIKKELALASQNNLVVIPVRIEDVIPNEAFAYEFATRQWIDMFDDWENSIAHLVELIAANIDENQSVDRVLAAAKHSPPGTLGDAPTPRKSGWQSQRALLMTAALGVVLVVSVGVWVANIYRPLVSLVPTSAQLSPTPVLTPPPVQPFIPMQAPVPPVPPPSTVAPTQRAATLAPITVSALSPEQERALKPKDTFKECDKCPEMIVVPAGSFTMGSPTNELDHNHNEGPQHRVTFAQQFAVGEFALTFDEWDACVADGGCNGYQPGDQGWGRGRRPVINVSWDDAKTYVAWLAKKTGKSYRLLSEAEREYVTRAGTTTPFWWGSSISTSQANYDGNYTYGNGVIGEYRGRTVSVDSFAPNPWGLYQVHGNVREWTEDCFHVDYEGVPYDEPPADGAAWTSDDCTERAVRGGSWVVGPVSLRAASRSGYTHDDRSDSDGFRVARTLQKIQN
jgi:formylglycine-generating enzyme required for sulfatase activity